MPQKPGSIKLPSDAGRSTNDGAVTYSTADRTKPDTSSGQRRNERLAAAERERKERN